jgi:hypothetical protein
MHFLQNLLNYMCPPFIFLFGQGEDIPVGFDRVITSRGGFVITSANDFVIAKAYV